jgi:hypothetical protein
MQCSKIGLVDLSELVRSEENPRLFSHWLFDLGFDKRVRRYLSAGSG